jgi:hypothetical protein
MLSKGILCSVPAKVEKGVGAVGRAGEAEGAFAVEKVTTWAFHLAQYSTRATV